MEAEKIARYQRFTRYLEEPIREIVPAMWQLPYVLDTGHTCSGHILAQPQHSYERYSSQYGWYPHRAILEFGFSEDPALTDARDRFRADLKGVSAQEGRVRITFNDVWTSHWDRAPSHPRVALSNLREMYNADIPQNLEKTEDSVRLVENLLVHFWEQIATVVRTHNPQAQISPIQGKNFRNVINWDHWASCFPTLFS
jgi:hypothetical protein